MVIHVSLIGFEFEVLDPPELVDRVRALRDLLSRALDRSAGAPAEGS